MFTSLRSRLWLSYAVLIFIALCITLVVLVVYIIRSPIAYQQSLSTLRATNTIIQKNLDINLSRLSEDSLQNVSERYDSVFDIRVIMITTDRELLADSRIDSQPPLPLEDIRLLRLTHIIKDENNQSWVFVVDKISENRWLLLAEPRSRNTLLVILREEVLLPYIGAGILALLLSLLVAYSLARWIASPLQDLLAAARSIPTHEQRLLPLRGPQETKVLIRAFNEMLERLKASQKSQREFVANVSHELKTPLTSIQGFAQAILDGTAETSKSRKQAASVIQSEAARMHRMVINLLDLARFDAGTFNLKHSTVELRSLLENIIDKFSPQAAKAEIKLQLHHEHVPQIIADGDRLAQVFTNLVDNALKFTQPGGQVDLSLKSINNSVQITIQDNGIGIPKHAVNQIFNRFYKGDPSRKGGADHGTGLGLAIAREIVQAHGGDIHVHSELNHGSTFIVKLPLDSSTISTVISKRKNPDNN